MGGEKKNGRENRNLGFLAGPAFRRDLFKLSLDYFAQFTVCFYDIFYLALGDLVVTNDFHLSISGDFPPATEKIRGKIAENSSPST